MEKVEVVFTSLSCTPSMSVQEANTHTIRERDQTGLVKSQASAATVESRAQSVGSVTQVHFSTADCFNF